MVNSTINTKQTKESFDLLIKDNLRVFQNHKKQEKIILFSSFSVAKSKQTTMILNFLNKSTFALETADIKLAFLQSAVTFYPVAIVGLTDFSRILFGDSPRDSRLHQIIPPPISLTRNPV